MEPMIMIILSFLIAPSTTLLIIFVSTLFLILFWFRFWNRKSVLPLPPGKTGWPILGENIDYFSMARKGNPEKFIEDRMNKYSSQLFKTSLIGQTMAVFCGPEGNKFVFSNEGNLFRSWWPKSVERLFPVDATNPMEELKKTRALLRAYLKPQTVNGCTEVMDSLMKRHPTAELNHKEVVMGSALAKKINFLFALRLFINVESPEHVEKLHNLYKSVVAGLMSVHINLPGTAYNQALKASKLLQNELIHVIKRRKIELLLSEKMVRSSQVQQQGGEDLLSYMLMETDENGHFMTESIIASKLIAVLVASYDSVSNILAFTLKCLAELPHIYTEVLREQREIAKSKAPGELLNLEDLQKMTFTWNVVNEVMRITPTFQGTFAEAICDISYAGFSFPKGWKVHWNAFSTHKNPEYFPEPERFDPSRFDGNGPAPYTFVPFGGGPRICPGMAFARCAILVFVHNMVIRYSWKKLIPNEKTFYDPLPRIENGLPILLQPHEA